MVASDNFDERIAYLEKQYEQDRHERQQRDQQSAFESLLEFNIELTSAAYEKSIAYTNAIVIAGYAVAFTIWSSTREQLPKHTEILSALLLLISATAFIIFEITKMTIQYRRIRRMISVYNGATSFDEIQRRIKAHERKIKSIDKRFYCFWGVIMFTTISTGLTAVIIMAYSFIINLLT